MQAASFLGSATRLSVLAAGKALSVMVPAGQPVPGIGETVRIGWKPADLHYMEGEPQ